MNKKKLDVVQHALVLFQEKGIIQTSIQDIIERSSISKGTFYNYFKSKNECIYAAIEHVRYEASLIRSEIQLGEANDDVSILIEQLVKKSHMIQLYGLPAIFEEMVHSSDQELKEYVLLYRAHELAWFSNRIIDIYGEEIRPYSFEVSVLFHGMLHHIKFIKQYVDPILLEEDTRHIVRSLLTYLKPIIDNLLTKQTAVLNQQNVKQILGPLKMSEVKLADLIEELAKLQEQLRMTKHQREIVDAVVEELQKENLRLAVLRTLLPAFIEVFKSSDLYEEVRQIHTQIWTYMNQK